MGAEVRQCAGLWRQIAGKLLEKEAFGPLPEVGQNCKSKPIAFAVKQSLQFKALNLFIPFIVFSAVFGESSTRGGAAVVASAAETRGR